MLAQLLHNVRGPSAVNYTSHSSCIQIVKTELICSWLRIDYSDSHQQSQIWITTATRPSKQLLQPFSSSRSHQLASSAARIYHSSLRLTATCHKFCQRLDQGFTAEIRPVRFCATIWIRSVRGVSTVSRYKQSITHYCGTADRVATPYQFACQCVNTPTANILVLDTFEGWKHQNRFQYF